MLRNRSLRATIALAFTCLLLIMAAVVGFAVREIEATQANRQLVSDELLPAADAADRMALNALKFDDALQAFLTSRSPADLSTARSAGMRVQHAAEQLRRVRLSDLGNQYQSAQVAAAADDFVKQAQAAERYALTTPVSRAATFEQQYLQGSLTTLVTASGWLSTRLQGQVDVIRAQVSQRDERLTRSLVLAFGLAGLVGVGLAIYCLRLVTEPVGRLLLAAGAVQAGDYSKARRLGESEGAGAGKKAENELSALTRAFVHMADTLDEREQRLRAQAAHLAATNASLTALQSLTDVALSDLPLNSLLQQLLQRAASGVGADAGAIFLHDPASNRLEPCATLPPGDPPEPATASAAVAAFLSTIVDAGPVVACSDLAAQASPAPAFLARSGVAAFLAVPIRVGGRVLGMAHLDFAQPRSFEAPAINLIQVFGERIARAVERARAMEELASWGREMERRVEQQKGQLLRQEHLAAIGLVGQSIAHELRNPLGVISNAVYFLRRRAGLLDEKMQRHLEIIEREIAHSTDIIRNLVDFSTGVEPETRRLDLNALIRAALDYSSIPNSVQVELDLDPGLPLVVGDEGQLLQVFANLVRNALQAMEGTGQLRVTSAVHETAVWATVADTGPGVRPEDQRRIFDPLVTTRAKGMGLGLSLTRKILEAHGGDIHLVSEPGAGAAFTVELPLTDPWLPKPAEPPAVTRAHS